MEHLAGYPVDLLRRGDTALVLFAARWLGKQDAAWCADAGMRGTCVDIDGDKLDEMRGVYPDGWLFEMDDAFAYAEDAAAHRRAWDVVSLDPFTGMFDDVLDRMDLWCQVAHKFVIVGHGRRKPECPDGWAKERLVERSAFRGGVYWTVLRPC